jgi:hypothetical protein
MIPIIVSWLYALMQLTTPVAQDEQDTTDSLLTMKQRSKGRSHRSFGQGLCRKGTYESTQ